MVARRGNEGPKAAGSAPRIKTKAAEGASSRGSAPSVVRDRARAKKALEPSRGPGPYKLLAIDLDGTLLPHEGEAHADDVQALRKLRARGVKVTILTGRLYSGTKPTAELLGLDGPVGCADGSHVVHTKGDRTLLHHGIRGRAADRLRDSLEQNDLIAFLFAENAIVHDERGAGYLAYVKTWSTEMRYVHRVAESPLWDTGDGMTAVVALGSEASIGRVVADIQRDETEAIQVAMFPFHRDGEQWGMVARAAGGTKGTALPWMAQHHGIDLSETVCVGDWHNDLAMLSVAGRSFAMGQAPAEVKSVATDVLERGIHDGGAIAELVAKAFPR
ncbi:MAG: Hydrolase superfamily [Labilithrix sp.]|nr:Hydrolase superfamily [Labilithrix sp.]